jgi:methionyl-tRNA formyltransferase
MDEGIDSGPIIMQEKINIDEDDTAKSLYDKFTNLGESLFIRFLELWLSGKEIPSTSQNENEATYFPKELPNNGEIDWSWNGEKIKNFIRAMTFEPFPPASFNFGKKKMVIVDEKYFKRFD